MIPRKSFSHWLGKCVVLPEPLTREQSVALYRKLRMSDDKEIWANHLIEGHIRLVFAIVAEFCRTHGYKSDDLVSEGLIILCESVYRMANGSIDHHTEPNPTGYLSNSIRNQLKNFIREDAMLRPSHETSRKGRARPHVISTDAVSELDYSVNRYKKGSFDPKLYKAFTYTEDTRRELHEILVQCIETNREKQVIDLRLKGNDDTEIAALLSISKVRVGQLRSAVANRVNEILMETKS
jgi:RNA polymerase sigma factor (sigma-70 family)